MRRIDHIGQSAHLMLDGAKVLRLAHAAKMIFA